MDFKVAVYASNGVDELDPCTLEKARELCAKGKAVLIKDGTAIRLMEMSSGQTIANRTKQQAVLLTAKNIFENNLYRLDVVGSPKSGKTRFIVNAAKTLPGLASNTRNRINVVFLLAKDQASFLQALTNAYQDQQASTKTFITVDNDPSTGFYYVNRNDTFGHTNTPVKSQFLTIIPLQVDNLPSLSTLNTTIMQYVKGNYVIFLDEAEEPASLAYKTLVEQATLIITTRNSVGEDDEIKLTASYR